MLMSFSIGVRVYQINVENEENGSQITMSSGAAEGDVYKFFFFFFGKNTEINDHSRKQRSWYFEKNLNSEPSSLYGYIKYGTYGFESDLIDRKTKENNYRRKAGDLEEIPLYFHFWIPEGSSFGLVAFQSFGSRSCVTILIDAATKMYSEKRKGYKLRFRKLMPEDVKGSGVFSAPVKRLTLIRKMIPKNIEDKYLSHISTEECELEVSIKAKRKRSLGEYGKIFSLFSGEKEVADKPVLRFNGLEFDQAKAEINFGNKRRTVGLLGYNSDAGVIDLTDAVEIGADGHPLFESICEETKSIILDFFDTLSSKTI